MASLKQEKILVVQTSFLGDAVLTTPLFPKIRGRFPKAQVAVLCTPQARYLFESNPDIDEILTDDKRGTERGLIGVWRKAKDLKSRGFTIAISPHKSFRSALLVYLAGIPFRVGFCQSAGWFFYHHRVRRDPTRHDVQRNLSLLAPFGIDPAKGQQDLRIEVNSGSREAVERLFRALGIERSGLIFGVNPGSVWPTKRWIAQGYAELIVQLRRKYDCQILIFGSAEDEPIVAKIQELSGNAGVSLVGKVHLKQLACALDWCDLFITNDSGPMHIAVARGVPVLAVFCATTPGLGFYPYTSRAVVIEKALPCRPCSSHGGRRCPLGTEDCMRLIKAEDVLRGVERLLNGKNQAGPAMADAYLPQFVAL
ncbi:MAG: lipopolysaccharide heptosyltransferase II [Deltaproteobacteria bacterium]|nr:lipopolysaccharide heptosyltransferase II [Deltaproteobacteria bacterium]